ncbi:MAG: hypothetical protein N4A44_01935 [Alphaproteobacteria bacterium]|jgi:deoxyribose-phosphate aldolase|nr:hypothetical protein [Alphaproteobacteria bacterium]
MTLDEFVKNNTNIISLNVYFEALSEDDIINICNLAKNNKFKNISTTERFIDAIWKNTEKENISNSVILDNFDNDFSNEELFKNIKNLCAKGVSSIEYIPQKDISIEELDKSIEMMAKAKFKRVSLFVVLENHLFENNKHIKNIIESIILNKNVAGIKISSGSKNENADSFMFNIAIDVLNSSERFDFKIDTSLNIYDSGKFLEADNVQRLANLVLGDEWAENNLIISFSYDLFKRDIISL